MQVVNTIQRLIDYSITTVNDIIIAVKRTRCLHMSPPCKYISHVMVRHPDSGLVYDGFGAVGSVLNVRLFVPVGFVMLQVYPHLLHLSVVGQFLEVCFHFVLLLYFVLDYLLECYISLASVPHLLWTWFQPFKVHYLSFPTIVHQCINYQNRNMTILSFYNTSN